MKNNLIGIGIVILVLVGIMYFARSSSDLQESRMPMMNGPITLEESSYNFGRVSMASGKVMHQFSIRNTSKEPVNISKIYTSCMCTYATLLMGDKKFGPYGMPGHGFIPKIGEFILPGEEAVVEVIFDPAAHGPAGVGAIERTVVLENSTEQPIQIRFSALVTP